MNLAMVTTSSACWARRLTEYGESSVSQTLRGAWQDFLAGRHRVRAVDAVDEAQALIYEIGQECSEADWDGEGALPVPRLALEEAELLARLLPASMPFPDICPDPDGAVSFVWRPRRGYVFVLSVYGRRQIVYAGVSGTSSETHGSALFGPCLPTAVVEFLKGLYF